MEFIILLILVGIFYFIYRLKARSRELEAEKETTAYNYEIKKTANITFEVVGVTYENRQEHLESLYARKMEGGELHVWLTPEPNNEYDKNAILVVSSRGQMGYVPADTCERVHKFIADTNANYALRYIIRSRDYDDTYRMKVRLYKKILASS